jgi:hypothetical protein
MQQQPKERQDGDDWEWCDPDAMLKAVRVSQFIFHHPERLMLQLAPPVR